LIRDIDDLLNSLQVSLAEILEAMEKGETISVNKVDDTGPFKVTTNVRIRSLDDFVRDEFRSRTPALTHEPLVDYFETEEGVRVLVTLPGVRKEDVAVSFGDDALHLRISSGGMVHERDIPCGVKPSELTVRSVVENNSVIEVRFARKGRSRKHVG
jgi:HSP20 family molecular chaperone IbpA